MHALCAQISSRAAKMRTASLSIASCVMCHITLRIVSHAPCHARRVTWHSLLCWEALAAAAESRITAEARRVAAISLFPLARTAVLAAGGTLEMPPCLRSPLPAAPVPCSEDAGEREDCRPAAM